MDRDNWLQFILLLLALFAAAWWIGANTVQAVLQ